MNEQKREQVVALRRLGWPLRRIEEATGVRRETASAYLKAAGVAVRRPGWRRRERDSKPAIETSTDPAMTPEAPVAAEATTGAPPVWPPVPTRSPQASACEPYREAIERALARHRDGAAIYRDLVDDHGFAAGYASVRRFVRRLRAEREKWLCEAHPVIETAAGAEAQVDYGATGRWCGTPRRGSTGGCGSSC